MPKYTTLTELAAAFKSGELDRTYFVRMDKGGCLLTLEQHGPEEGENERYEKCRELFKRPFGDPMPELMTLAGLPAEWC